MQSDFQNEIKRANLNVPFSFLNFLSIVIPLLLQKDKEEICIAKNMEKARNLICQVGTQHFVFAHLNCFLFSAKWSM